MANDAHTLTAVQQNGSIRYLDQQLKGAATGLLLFFLLNPGLTFCEEDLEFYVGYSRPTLRGALRSLARFDLVRQLGERPVWALSAHVRQLDFSDVAGGSEEKNFFPTSSSSSTILDPDLSKTTTTDSLTATEEKNFSTEAALTEAGVFPRLADELAQDSWVTEERIAAWLQRLGADRRVRSVPAVLYTNLKRHLEPGEGAKTNCYLCPVCNARPCMCEEQSREEESHGTQG